MVYLKSYKELIVWQKSMDLVEIIFHASADFPKSELYGIVSQMRRATVSIPSNIAEGYGRRSRKEFLQFLGISYGSLLELETQVIVSKRLKFIGSEKLSTIEGLLEEISKMLYKMMFQLDAKP